MTGKTLEELYNNKVLDYEDRCRFELFSQLFNTGSNHYQELDNIPRLFYYFEKVLSSRVSHKFVRSLTNSRNCFHSRALISSAYLELETNNPESFLVLSFFSSNHIFSGILKKIDSDYSLIVINKTKKPINKSSYDEYIIKQTNFSNLMEEACNSSNLLKTHEIYDIFQKYAYKNYPLIIESLKIKNNNFFLKEFEAAIKLAYSTIAFSIDEFINLRKQNNLGKAFKPLWYSSTEDVYKDMLDFVKKESPYLGHILSKEYEVYLNNKHFRRDLESSLSSTSSYYKDLDKINYDTFIKKENYFLSNIENLQDKDRCKTLKQFLSILKPTEICKYSKHRVNFSRLNNILDLALPLVPLAVPQLKYEYHLCYLFRGINYLIDGHFEKALSEFNYAINLYTYDHLAYFLRGLCYLELAETNKALSSIRHTIHLKPDFEVAFNLISEIQKREYEMTDTINSSYTHEVNNCSYGNDLSLKDTLKSYAKKVISDLLAQIDPERILQNKLKSVE